MTDNTTPDTVESGGGASRHLELLVRQKSAVLVFMLSAVVCTVLLTYIVSEKYEAATIIYYRPIESTVLKAKETEAFGSPVPLPSFKVVNQTLQDVVKSEMFLRPVVESLHLAEKKPRSSASLFSLAYQWGKETLLEVSASAWSLLKHGRIVKEDPVLKEIGKISQFMTISAKKESYLFVLKAKYNDREKASDIVNAVGIKLVDWLKVQNRNILEQNLSRLKAVIAAKESQLNLLRNQKADLLDSHHFVSLQDETVRGVENLYSIQLDQADVLAKIAEKQKRIEEIARDTKQQTPYINPEDYKRIASLKLLEGIDLQGLLAKNANMDQSIASTRQKLQEIPLLQKKLDALEMNIQAAVHEYQQLNDLFLESSERYALGASEVRILHPALAPLTPVQPIKIYHVLFTALMSGIFAVGMVYVLAFFNIHIFFSDTYDRKRRLPPGEGEGAEHAHAN